jgi:hypothetical protein
MKKYLLVILWLISISSGISATTYYVAPTGGNDSNAGTNIAAPWATWQKAFNTAQAGDIVYFRGGVWYPTSAYGNNITMIDPNNGIGYDGTASNPICYYAYPADYALGNYPILDCKRVTTAGGFNTGININNAEFLKFKGLTVRNVYQKGAAVLVCGINIYNCDNFTFENMRVHNLGGRAFYYESSAWSESVPYDTTRFINCDMYNLADSSGVSPGNMADGIKGHMYPKCYIQFEGCRIWNSADDGYDFSGSGVAVFNRCWAWNIGHLAVGNGSGFKIGAIGDSVSYPTRIVTNCLAAWCHNSINVGSGFGEIDYFLDVASYYRVNARIYNNTAYKCDFGFSAGTHPNKQFRNSIYRNNISYQSNFIQDAVRYNVLLFSYWYPESNNTWDFYNPLPSSMPPWFVETDTVTVSNLDFISIDSTGLSGPRQSDGSLPIVNFLKLAPSSDLIDAGTQIPVSDNSDIILAYSGSAPDMGYAEASGSNLPTVTTTTIYSINVTTASGGGNVTNDGGDIVTARGVCWSISSDPTIANPHTVNGEGTGIFTSSLTSLTQGTFYYVRAYATNSNGTIYGNQVTFTTLTIPTLTTVTITSITETTAVSGGTISSDGGSAIIEKGVCWSISANPTIAQSHTSNGTGSTAFTSNITGLTGGFTYFVRAYATNSVGTSYGNQLSFVAITPVEEYKIIMDGIYVIMDDDKVTSTEGGGADILVTGITVSGTGGATTISTNDGTLQMLASVLPVDATDPTVIWSRTNGTGTASISTGGLLTALTNGNVTTRATANDGSGIYDDQIITLSNQNILVTGITVTGTGGATTISTPDGTLQLITTVLPVDASNPTVTWSVTSGTGYATIGSSGILTAVTDGTVTARATANDGSGVYGTLEVTISNQIVSSQIIADHTIVDRYDHIPAYYINEVKKMLFVIAGESHAGAFTGGLEAMEALNPIYNMNRNSYPDAPLSSEYIRVVSSMWGDYYNATGWIGHYGEEDWFTNASAIAQTKTGLSYCNNNGYPMSVFGFAWCYDAEAGLSSTNVDPVYGVHWYGNSIGSPEGDIEWGLDAGDYSLTGNSVSMDSYIAATQSYVDYCTAQAIPTAIFFTTGTVDSYTGQEISYQAYLKWEHLRDYVDAHPTAILFDYADILCYDNNGTLTTTTWNGHTYPHITATNYGTGSEAHIGEPGILRIGKALWWMFARIAGWDGN